MLFNCGHYVCRKCLHSDILGKFNSLELDYFLTKNEPFLYCPVKGCNEFLNSYEIFDTMLESRTGDLLKEKIKYAVSKGKFKNKFICPKERCCEFISKVVAGKGDTLDEANQEKRDCVSCKICSEYYNICEVDGCFNLTNTSGRCKFCP